MKIVVSNKLTLTNLAPTTKRAIKNALTLANPQYFVMLKKGNTRALYGIKSEFKYYEDQGEWLLVGRGNLNRLKNYIEKNNVKADITYDVSTEKLTKEFKSQGLVLRDYQEGITEEILKHDNGVIKLDTGFGKSIISLKLIEATQLKTLIIVPRVSLMNQFKQEIEKYFKKYPVGIIQGNKFDIKDITLASVSTLQKRDLSSISRHFGLVLVDEAHTMITDARLKAIMAFNPAKLYGLTATPNRNDGQGQAIRFTFGDTLVDRSLPKKNPTVHVLITNSPIPVREYPDMVKKQIENQHRNTLIANSIIDLVDKEKRKVLVLTKRIDHFNRIEEMLANFNYVVYKFSSQSEERHELLMKMKSNEVEFDILMGTFSLLSVGVDIPILDTVVFAGDLKSEVLSEQSAGRVLRLLKGKQPPKIIDVVDNYNPIFLRQAKARFAFYKKMGWEVTQT